MSDKMSQYASQIPTMDGSSSGDYPQYVVLNKELPNPIRLVDTPDGVERYYISWILCDDGTKRPFIIENDHQGKGVISLILGDRTKFYSGGILETVPDPITRKGKLLWEDKDPELVQLVAFSNDPSGKSGSWKAKEEFIFNAIQRNPETDSTGRTFNWCKENKHTKILRMGISAFKHLQDVRLNDGNPSEYDINYIIKGSGMNTQHNIMKAGSSVPNVVIGPLTPEETAYTRYDLKAVSSLTPASRVLQYLGNTIARIDALLGTTYLQRLQQEAEKESSTASPSVETVSAPQQPSPAPARLPRSAATQSNLVPCGFCKSMIPQGSEICPSCKNTLMEPCANPACRKKFSVFESVCPHCGQEYQVS